MKLVSVYLVLFALAVSNVKFICGVNIMKEFSDDDDESGSGSEEDPMTLTKNRHDVSKVVDAMKKMHNAKTNEDLSESLKTGARQVMHTIASKLVSHASNKITNHVGHIIKSSLVNKKSGVSSDIEKDKSLSSSTEVVLPALSVSKLSESGASNGTTDETKTTNTGSNVTLAGNSSSPVNKTASQKHAIPGGSSSTTDTGGEGKVEAMGEMEGIEIKINGKANTVNNFTKLQKDPEVRYEKTKSLKFTKKEVLPKEKSQKKNHVKNNSIKKRNKHKKKRSKKNKLAKHFPKIILYQGPISKALENILKARSTSYNPRFINAPMSFEEATADIKRSSISKENKKASKVFRDEEDESDEEEEEEEERDEKKDSSKKSKVAAKAQRKYTVKGFQDASKPVRKSTKGESKTEIGRKKFAVSSSGKTPKQGPIPILTINPSSADADDDSKDSVFHDISPKLQEQGKNLKPYKPLIVPNDDEPQTGQFTDFVNQMSLPGPVAQEFVPHKKIGNRPTPKKSKGSFIIGESPKPLENQPPGPHSKETPSGPNEFEYPNPAGYTTMGDGGALTDQEEEEEEKDNGEFDYGRQNNTNSSQSPVFSPSQHKPQPLKENPGTPPAVTNAQDFDNEEPPPESDNSYPKPFGFPVPEPQQNNLPNFNNNNNYNNKNPDFERETMERIQANSQNIASLANELRDVESRLEEVGTAVNEMEKDIVRVEKKLDEKRHKEAKEDFTKFAGPLSNLQTDNPGVKLPVEVLPPGRFPINLMQGRRPNKRPKVLKQFFIPLPRPNSPAANAIDQGAPVNELPWPLNKIVPYLLRKVEKYQGPVASDGPFRIKATKPRPWQPPHPVADDSFPPKEHDIESLETELGMKPVSRIPVKKPKIIIFSKSPNLFDLTEKPCNEPCQNGGECIGGNVCKCPPMFSGPKCDRAVHRSVMPGDIMDLMGPLPLEQEASPKKSNAISLPFVLTETNNINEDEDNTHQKTVGQVDQSKLVDILSQFGRPFLPEILKRSKIPRRVWTYQRK
ncbi:uncharacterized protein DDB_G0284459-like isoform X2 [Hydractinia symbiolongicarpus]|uniref:uncharacterized protein DDB_G0284459-like isoform X2 n=1 Tax=Hydractinia symbiolongicarpus TaxID=13093 RepID=UPI00254F4CBD|nr:uncharacterized protein DDB_G0284459-like isoform X2 [Hydractinia symbiolongicarpus]